MDVYNTFITQKRIEEIFEPSDLGIFGASDHEKGTKSLEVSGHSKSHQAR